MKFDCFPREFFLPTADVVAPLLLGHTIWRRLGDEWVSGIIVEVEAYLADDPACHAYKRRTARVEKMYGPPGKAYIYLIYGFHHCLNFTCLPEGQAEAVLIRGLEPVTGMEAMRERRSVLRDRDLLNGPGKLCQAMGLTLKEDGLDLCDPEGELVFERNPHAAEFIAARGPVVQTTRIGITKAAELPLRWYLKGSDGVSRF